MQHPSPQTVHQDIQGPVFGSVCKAGSRIHQEEQRNEETREEYYDKLMEALTTPAWDGYAEPDESDENRSPEDKQTRKREKEKRDTERSGSMKASKIQKKEKEKEKAKKRSRSRKEKKKDKK